MRPLFTFLLLSAFLNSVPVRAGNPGGFEPSLETRQRRNLVQVALGRLPADRILRGAKVLNVFTLEWWENTDIVISGSRIAWVGPSGKWPGKSSEIVDVTGYYAVPGFGESHKHIEGSFLTPEYETASMVPHGDTWMVEGSHLLSNVLGKNNLNFWKTVQAADLPLKIFVALGSTSPPSAFEEGMDVYDGPFFKTALAENREVMGSDEMVDWAALADPKSPSGAHLWEVMQAVHEGRGMVQGHGAGLYSLEEISGFAASGVMSDHEGSQAEEIWNKVGRGLFMQLRPEVMPFAGPFLVKKGVRDWSNFAVCSDLRTARLELKMGGMDYNIREAIRSGIPVEAAYAMGSYYPARHWRVDEQVGSLAPGRLADVVLLKDPKTVTVDKVYSNGRLVADQGKYLPTLTPLVYPEAARKSVHIPRPLTSSDFAINAPAGKKEVTAALLKPFYFEENFMTASLPVREGKVQRIATTTKVAVIDRFHDRVSIGKMFWTEVGPSTPDSALCCSMSHELNNVWVVGSSDAAMAMAVNELRRLQGGWVLVRGNQVVATVPLEIGGLMSQRPATALAADFDHLDAEAEKMTWLGKPGIPNQLIFSFLTGTPWKWAVVAPSAKNPTGLVKVTTGETHAIVW